jgi:predicted O-linked N-acetylglucosamine transferase (SPINDLY family)
LERLDRERFEMILFHPGDSAIEGTGEGDTAVELPTRIAEARARIAEAKPDLLYFPDIGMSALTYFLAFARLAPVQCIGWGHPDTTGIPNADYWLSAADWEPEDGERHYSERLVRLRHPPVYYPRPAPPPKKSRAELGLPANGRLYLAPMSLFKFHPQYDAVLARILDADTDAHLLLATGHAPEWNELLQARIAGVSPGAARRLLFLPRLSFPDFQALAALGDAFLDPIYFGGGRTSLDLFAQGVPIVNWPGPFMRSRITYGFYRRMEMTDLVAADHDAYAALALRLARELDWREAMRRKVAERSAVLYENDAAVRELEAFFQAAVEAASDGRRLERWRAAGR